MDIPAPLRFTEISSIAEAAAITKVKAKLGQHCSVVCEVQCVA
jgi:hypothetical protein